MARNIKVCMVVKDMSQTLKVYGGFLQPLLSYRQRLMDVGIEVRMCGRPDVASMEADVFVFVSKVFTKELETGETDIILRELVESRRRSNVTIWFDNEDSSANAQFFVMPCVDRYLKAFLLKNKTEYTNGFYGGRIYTDYYHRTFLVEDSRPYISQSLKVEHASKLHVGWNYSLNYYGKYAKVLYHLKKITTFKYWPMLEQCARNLDRHQQPVTSKSLISMRFSSQHARETIAFQRKSLNKQGSLMGISIGTVNYQTYTRELVRSRICVSPFGWGEACFRDYEAMLAGAALLKPDMSHLVTFPDIYVPHQTYEPFSWDLKDFKETLIQLLENDRWRVLAKHASTTYFDHLYSDDRKNAFCEHVANALNCRDESSVNNN